MDEFFLFYQNADLVSYSELVDKGANSISQLLNDAWLNAQTNPGDYFTYETSAITSLKGNYGLY